MKSNLRVKNNLHKPMSIIIFALCLSLSDQIAAQTQNPRPISAEANHSDVTHRVQLQFLVASNIANTKTNYPMSLESVVKQLKSLQPFKNHYLVATYLYNVADGSALEVRDVTYASFEGPGGLHPIFFDLRILGLKLTTNDSVRVPRFSFEARQRIAMSAGTPSSDVVTGITTDLNLKDGVPTIVGTITNALSDGALVLVITVNHVGVR